MSAGEALPDPLLDIVHWPAEHVISWIRDTAERCTLDLSFSNLSDWRSISGRTLVQWTSMDFNLFFGDDTGTVLYQEFVNLRELNVQVLELFDRLAETTDLDLTVSDLQISNNKHPLYDSRDSLSPVGSHYNHGYSDHQQNTYQQYYAGYEVYDKVEYSTEPSLLPLEDEAIVLGHDLQPIANEPTTKDKKMLKKQKHKSKGAAGQSNPRRQTSGQTKGISESSATVDLTVPSTSLESDEEEHIYSRVPGIKDRERGPFLWEFMARLIVSRKYNPSVLEWEDESKYSFKVNDTHRLARLWSARSGKTISYSHLSRGLRYHYGTGYLESVRGRRLTYRFGEHAMDLLKQIAQSSSNS